MRGSQGAGIRVLTKAELLACASDSRLRCRSRPGLSFPIVQPYLAEPLVASGGPYKGHKWDLRTYVLCTSVLPMRLYLFTEAIVRSAAAVQIFPPNHAPCTLLPVPSLHPVVSMHRAMSSQVRGGRLRRQLDLGVRDADEHFRGEARAG